MHACSEICQFKVAPKSAMGQRLQRLGRPVVAVSKHLCVAEYVSSGLHPTFKVYKGFAGPNAAASIHMCIAEITPAPKGRNSIKASPTNCYCVHTHVCCRMDHLELHPRIKSYKGSPDQLLQRAYTCALQTNRINAAPKGRAVTRVRPTGSS